MKKDDGAIVFCQPVEVAERAVDGQPRWCSICGQTVWASYSSIELVERDGATVACTDCMPGVLESTEGRLVLTSRQRQELIAAGVRPEDIDPMVRAARREMGLG